ncbi:MAG: hypothetical protein RJA07_2541 [Bacteroidota bacterium]|jgi:hypothetical protein
MKKYLLFFVCLLAITSSCKKKIVQDKVYDNVIYDVGKVPIYQSAADKKRIKTPTQFISILYADLFQNAISTQQLNDLSILYSAQGDKGITTEMLVSNYMNSAAIKMPTNTVMRSDIDKFLTETFIRFYLRNPTSYEKYYFKNLIQTDANITPEFIYSSFALSDEYWYY